MTTTVGAPPELAKDNVWKTVHRVVFPVDGDTDILPLYVDFNAAQRVAPESQPNERSSGPVTPAVVTANAAPLRADFVVDRRRLSLPAYRRVSLGTYFNAFPASYWRAHTDVRVVRLSVEVDAEATVVVYRSTPRGTSHRVESLRADKDGTVVVDLPITNFGDGGWYWFDLIAHDSAVTLNRAEWSVPQPEGFIPGTFSVGVTTFNRPDYCVRHLRTLADSGELLEILDRLIVTDQGTRKVRDEPGYAEAAEVLGAKFALVEQANLGGSGGFARGMHETVQDGRSRYVMLLDDDVEVETEGMLRAVHFADFTRTPMIVGGHMFNLLERAVMHNFGEAVNEYRFRYGSADNTKASHDFSGSNLRTTPWMHRRVDVDYNGWWMCLVPTAVIREIGLALPVFIKWDDVEYGMRAKSHGFRTVTLPGAAVWHMPWTEKDDTIDWQAYYHQRNRWLAALVYSPYKRGGRMPKESLAVDMRHLLSMQYSAVELRLQALEDILKGPDHLHNTIGNKLAEVRAVRGGFDDARVSQDVSSFPPVKRLKPLKRGKAPTQASTLPGAVVKVITGALRQVKGVPTSALTNPEATVPATDARWWRLSQLDSALVSSSDGTGASWYKRDSEKFRSMSARSAALHQRLYANWDSLSEAYRTALPEFTSPAVWARTFESVGGTPPGKKAE